jgi:uncharacterized membrane protein SirB2
MLMALKTIHLTCAVLTFISFSVRGVWMLADSDMLQRAWVKVAPHVIDTVLLASAIGLTIQIRQYPGSEAWLTAKLVALVLYIVCGSIALKRGRTKTIRVASAIAALVVFFYIVAVALTHSPWPFVPVV